MYNKLPTTYTDGRYDKYTELEKQMKVMQDLLPRYGGRTLENIIQDINARRKEMEL